MPRSGKTRRVMSNDDGWILGETPVPITPKIMWDRMIGPHEGSPIDGFLWSIGGHNVYTYETEIGEFPGEGCGELDERHQRQADNLRHLIENHGGPVTVIAELCRLAGMDFFPSVRMNEHYDIDESSPSYSRFRREHPQYLIGRGEDIPGPTLEWGIRTGVDYAVPQVREHMTNIIVELLSRFDVDGIELDYMRHPAFFRIEEAYANRHLMTDMIRDVRGQMDRISQDKGKPLDLIVRVPPTLRDCERTGLDVAAWITDDLVDILIAGGGFIGFEMPMRQFVEAASGTSTQVYGCLEGLRPNVDELTMRAMAARYWEHGVDGLYLFNYYSMPQEWKRDVLGRLVDVDTLARLEKRYEMDQRGNVRTTRQLGYSFQNAIPATQVPLALQTTSVGPSTVVRMDIADDLETAASDGALGRCTLGLLFESLCPGDRIDIHLNGTSLDWADAARGSDGWTRAGYAPGWNGFPSKLTTEPVPGDTVEWQVGAPPLKRGVNEISVRLTSLDPAHDNGPVLKDVRVWVRYVQ